MKTITVTFQVSQEDFLKGLQRVAEEMGLKLVDDIDFNVVGLELSKDVEYYIKEDLNQFIREGWNNDLYQDCFKDSDYDGDQLVDENVEIPTHRLLTDVYYVDESSELRDYDEDFYDLYSGSAVSTSTFFKDGVNEDYLDELKSEGLIEVYINKGIEGWFKDGHFESIAGSDSYVEDEDVESIR